MDTKNSKNEEPLVNLNEEVIKKDLGFDNTKDINSDLDRMANEYLDTLLDSNLDELKKRKAVDTMGARTQVELANLSKMLDEPIKKLAGAGEEGSSISTSLLNLKDEVEKLDPARFDLTSAPGFLEKLSKYIPFIGNKLSRYFQRYMSSGEVITRIVDSLELGKEQLGRDNVTLSQDKERMISGLDNLNKTVQLGKLLDDKLQYKLDRDFAKDAEKSAFIQNELLYPLRQRVIDLQQSISVTQQGVLTIEIISRNNRELIRGVDRALNVTVSALQIAVASALALANQKITIKKIDAINTTTSKLIEENAKRLKTQGVEIQKQASESMLDIASLEQAFSDIKIAISDISKYKQEALPLMKQNILKMEKLNQDAFKEVENIKRTDNLESDNILEITV